MKHRARLIWSVVSKIIHILLSTRFFWSLNAGTFTLISFCIYCGLPNMPCVYLIHVSFCLQISVFAICWRLSEFGSPSHEKSIFLKFYRGHNWFTNYPDSEFHSHWKTVTLSSISRNLTKYWSFLAFWQSLCFGSFLLCLVVFSIVSSLSWYITIKAREEVHGEEIE